MPAKTFQVMNYEVSLARQGTIGLGPTRFYGYIACIGGANERLIIYFAYPDSVNAPGTFNPTNNTGTSFVPADQFRWYLDVLRHERPIWAHMSSEMPQTNGIKTGSEPTGEGGA